MRNDSQHREELELAARRSIEAQAGRPFTDEEWQEARRNLLNLARLVLSWKLKPEFPEFAARLSPFDEPLRERSDDHDASNNTSTPTQPRPGEHLREHFPPKEGKKRTARSVQRERRK